VHVAAVSAVWRPRARAEKVVSSQLAKHGLQIRSCSSGLIMGAEKFLRLLLENLKGDYVAARQMWNNPLELPAVPSFRSHRDVLVGMDFFTVEVLTLKVLLTYYVPFFIHLETRRVSLAGFTPYPDQEWIEQQARNMTMEQWGCDQEMASLLSQYQDAVQRLAEVQGLGVDSAQQIIAEIGPTATTFPSEKCLSSWVGACPGDEESAGVNYSHRSPKGNRHMRRVLNQAANAAVKAKGTIFEIVYRRTVRSLGHKQTIGRLPIDTVG
jgi:hypothetical protein